MSRRDYYQVLGVARDASRGDIRSAYARLLRVHHPDRAGDLTGRLADLQEAYRCLADRDARAAHDRMIAAADQAHAARQQRVQERLRRYDRRHPRAIPRSHRHLSRSKMTVIAAVAIAAAATWVKVCT